MNHIVGNDPSGNLRQLGVIGTSDGRQGLIITRLPMLSSDVFLSQYSASGLAVGLRTLNSGGLPAGAIYLMSAFGGRWWSGAANNIRLVIVSGVNQYVAGNNALTAEIPIVYATPTWLKGGDSVSIEANVTTAGTNLQLWIHFVRTPVF